MAGINLLLIIGHVGKDPDVRFTGDGKAVANFSVAVSERRGKGESQQEIVEWFSVTAFGKLAEIVGEHVKKGSHVYVEGKIRTEKWKDKSGADRSTQKVIADKVQFLGGKGERQDGAQEKAADAAYGPAKKVVVPQDDDIFVDDELPPF